MLNIGMILSWIFDYCRPCARHRNSTNPPLRSSFMPVYQLRVRPRIPSVLPHLPHNAQYVFAVVDARMGSSLQREVQVAQHRRHALGAPQAIMSSERVLEVDPAMERRLMGF